MLWCEYIHTFCVYILDWKMQKGLNKREECENKKKNLFFFLYSNERFFPSLLSYSSTLASFCRMLIYTYIFFFVLYWDMNKSFVIISHAHSTTLFQFTLFFIHHVPHHNSFHWKFIEEYFRRLKASLKTFELWRQG